MEDQVERLLGADLGAGIVLGTGDPTKPYGVRMSVRKPSADNTSAQVWVSPANMPRDK